MSRKLRPRTIYDVFAVLALVVALGGTGAYAANEWTGANIVDESLTGRDVFNNTIAGSDITNGSLTGADVFDNTIGSADVTNNSLGTVDIAELHGSHLVPDSVRGRELADLTGAEISDFSLNDEDIAQGTFVNFTASIGSVPAHDCRIDSIQGVNAQGDHMLLTPNATTGGGRVVYSITYDDTREIAWLTSCNTWSSAVNPGNVRFNLLVIDAQ